jgi:hypothetical protein
MKGIVLAGAVLMISSLAIAAPASDIPPGCEFSVPRSRPVTEIVGAPELAARVHVMAQSDSPLAIVRVDLTGVKLATGPGWYEESGTYGMDVRNISNRAVTDAAVTVLIRYGNAGIVANESGSGAGMAARRPIAAGEQLSLTIKSGPGWGTVRTDAEAMFVALVDWIKTPTCTYKPSQTWLRAPAPR